MEIQKKVRPIIPFLRSQKGFLHGLWGTGYLLYAACYEPIIPLPNNNAVIVSPTIIPETNASCRNGADKSTRWFRIWQRGFLHQKRLIVLRIGDFASILLIIKGLEEVDSGCR